MRKALLALPVGAGYAWGDAPKAVQGHGGADKLTQFKTLRRPRHSRSVFSFLRGGQSYPCVGFIVRGYQADALSGSSPGRNGPTSRP
jgi:hypothetical protein